MKTIITLIALLFAIIFQSTYASNYETILSLKGNWKFNIGDDMAWAEKDFDDSDWDEITAPSDWENQGYLGYDGYAWYRKNLTIPIVQKNTALYITLGNIDDVCEVYFNGKRIGQAGVFPPNFATAYNVGLNFYLPFSLINFNGENTIAIRVYDNYERGGIVNGKLAIVQDLNTQYLSQDLSGPWRLSFNDESEDKRIWHTVNVPSTWESQGFPEADGYAWYGKSFVVSQKLSDEQLYLSLGKIDDKDKVYINKTLIGTTSDMNNTPFQSRFKGDWQTRRAYKIPKGLIKTGEKNTLAILVFDSGGNGGIYEGPIGLMTEENYKKYEKVNEDEYYSEYPSFIEILMDIFN